MPTLMDALEVTPHRVLVGISRTHGLPGSSRTRKTALIQRLARHLGDPSKLHAIVQALTPEEGAALTRLAAGDGRMPSHEFTRQFGPIRPYRPWRPDSVRHPWRQPISSSERLLYLGLIFLIPGHKERQEPEQIVLPAEFRPLIAPPTPDAVPQPPVLDQPIDPVRDLATLLAYLQQTDVRLRLTRALVSK